MIYFKDLRLAQIYRHPFVRKLIPTVFLREEDFCSLGHNLWSSEERRLWSPRMPPSNRTIEWLTDLLTCEKKMYLTLLPPPNWKGVQRTARSAHPFSGRERGAKGGMRTHLSRATRNNRTGREMLRGSTGHCYKVHHYLHPSEDCVSKISSFSGLRSLLALCAASRERLSTQKCFQGGRKGYKGS